MNSLPSPAHRYLRTDDLCTETSSCTRLLTNNNTKQLETMTTHSTGLLVVVVCLWAPSLASAAPPKRVAVIGGGIGGASFAYYYRQAVPDAEVSPLHGTHKHDRTHAYALVCGNNSATRACCATQTLSIDHVCTCPSCMHLLLLPHALFDRAPHRDLSSLTNPVHHLNQV